MKYLRAEVGQIGGLGERTTFDGACTGEYSGIRGHKTGNVLPYLNILGLERRADYRCSVIRALKPQRCGSAIACGTDKALYDRYRSVFDRVCDRGPNVSIRLLKN